MGKCKDTYKFIGKNRISINELRKEVNALDKKFGAKLKHPDIWTDPDQYIEQYQADAERSLKSIICIINGVDPNIFVAKKDSVSIKTNTKTNENLTDLSFIDWSSNERLSVDSQEFRCKYVSLILSEIVGNVSKIVRRYVYKNNRVHHSMAEKGIIATKSLVNDCIKFAEIMMFPRQKYQNIILKMFEWLSYNKKGIEHLRFNELLVDHVRCSRNFAYKDPISHIAVYDDDQLIYAIMETSFMVCTEYISDDTGNIPKFKHVCGATREHDLVLLIEALGAAILQSKTPNKLSSHFRAFILSKPLIHTEYYKEAKDNAAIKYGLYAIAYLDFIYNDKMMTKLIDRMFEKGI